MIPPASSGTSAAAFAQTCQPCRRVPLRWQAAPQAEPSLPRAAGGTELAAATPGGHRPAYKVSRYTTGTCYAGFPTWLRCLLVQAVPQAPLPARTGIHTNSCCPWGVWPWRGPPVPEPPSTHRAGAPPSARLLLPSLSTSCKPSIPHFQGFLPNSTHSPD